MFGAVFVDATEGIPGVIFDEKGAFEQEFAAVATLIAFALSVFFLLRDIGFAKSQQHKASYFAYGLFAHFAKGSGHGKVLFLFYLSDFALCGLYAAFGVVNGDGEVAVLGFAAVECDDASGVAFKAFGVGIVGGGFEAYNVSIWGCCSVFPEGKVRHLFECVVERRSQIAFGVFEQYRCVAFAVASEFVKINLFDITRGGTEALVECFEAFLCAWVAWGDGFVRRYDGCAFFEEGRAVVAVVEQLHFSGFVVEVGDLIGYGEVVAAEFCRYGCGEAQRGTKHHGFIDDAQYSDATGRCQVDLYFDIARGYVGDFAVQGDKDFGFVAVVVDYDIFAGGAIAVEATAHDPFVEAFEPSQATPVVEFDEGRVDEVAHGRFPAEGDTAIRAFPYSHAARGNDEYRECPVVEFYEINPVLYAAFEGGFLYAPGMFCAKWQGGFIDGPRFCPECAFDIGEDKAIHAFHGNFLLCRGGAPVPARRWGRLLLLSMIVRIYGKMREVKSAT